jgi:hypothetical protein
MSQPYQNDVAEYAIQFSGNNESIYYQLRESNMNMHYTIQFWMKVVDLSLDFEIIGQHVPTGTKYISIEVYTDASSNKKIRLAKSSSTVVEKLLYSGWNHYAFRRVDSTMYLYVNNNVMASNNALTSNQPIWLNNQKLYFGYSTTNIGKPLFLLRELIMLNYKISDNYLNYLYTTKPYYFDFDPVVYFKFDDPNESGNFVNRGNPSTQAVPDTTYIQYILLDYSYTPLKRLCPQYQLPVIPQNAQYSFTNYCNTINYFTNTSSGAITNPNNSSTCYPEFTLEVYFGLNYSYSSSTFSNIIKYQNFSIWQVNSNIEVYYNSASIATYSIPASNWIYLAITINKMPTGTYKVILFTGDTRQITSTEISSYSCSANNNVVINTLNTKPIMISYVKVYDYALSTAELLFNRHLINFSRNNRIINYLDFRIFYKNVSNARQFYNPIDNSSPTVSATLTENTIKSPLCGKACTADLSSNYKLKSF